MLDPWNVAGVVLAASKIAWDIVVFWKDLANAPEEARELLHTIDILQESAQNVRSGFLANPDGIELQNYESIKEINNKCERDLYRLRAILPEPPSEDASRLEALRVNFIRKMSEDVVCDIVSGIKLCNNALQVELQTLAIFKMEQGWQHDHTSIQREWDRVLTSADDLLSHRPFRAGDPDWDSCLDNFVTSLKESASTSEGRSVIHPAHLPRLAYSPYFPNSPLPPRRDSQQSSISHVLRYREDGDSGVAIVDNLEEVKEETSMPKILRQSILPRTLQKVEICLKQGEYTKAAALQKQVIEYRQKFAGNTPVSTEVMCRDEMKLADIYRQIATTRALPLAEVVLINAIDRLETDNFEKPGLKNALLAELHHDLGRICVDLGKPGIGSAHLTDAFNLMVDKPSTPMPLLRSVSTLLYRIYTKSDKHEVAEALDEHAVDRCGFSLKTLAWCQEQGFGTELETFCFDKCDARIDSRVKGLSPLHVAAKSDNDDILRHMLAARRLDLEVQDEHDKSTPLLLACAQQDAVVVDLLLNNGARAAAMNNLRQNGLHLCQRATGGISVVKRLLAEPGALDVNAMDLFHSTPLHVAASKGNSKMVLLLLASNSDPNSRGPAGYTPLMATVQATMQSQEAKMEVLKALFYHGADASLEYEGGQTAADMANDSHVRKTLKGWEKERQGLGLVKRLHRLDLKAPVQGSTTSTLLGPGSNSGRLHQPPGTSGSSTLDQVVLPIEQGEGSRQDSGHVSRESADKNTGAGDDDASTYPVESIPPESRDWYITTFSNRLAQDIGSVSCSSEILKSCRAQLCEWVRVFALKLQQESPTRTCREASVLICKYRRNIVDELHWLFPSQASKHDSDCQGDESSPSLLRKSPPTVDEWIRGLQASEDAGTLSVISDDEEAPYLLNLAEYEQSIPKSQAYRWLLSKIKCLTCLEARGENQMAAISDAIRSQLLSQPALRHVSHLSPPTTVKVVFSLKWNPHRFWKDQGYDISPAEVIDHVVCLTGAWQHAEAMTVAEYMAQTWPNTYQPLLSLLKKALLSPFNGDSKHTLENGSTVTFYQNVFSCTVEAEGQVDFVAEIGEQLGWLAATLRSSPVSNGVVACVPRISSFQVPILGKGCAASVIASCQIDFDMTVAQDISCHSPGFCWASLFRNPLLVTNYPIRRRAEAYTGIEMSLPMMVELIRSRQLTRVGGRVILKGFCSLLVATAVAGDTVMWHLVYNPTGERISYCDPRLENIGSIVLEGFTLRDLEARRHILGWCSSIRECSGLPQTSLKIRPSNLPTPSRSIVIEKMYIEGGENVVAGLMIALGKKDKPTRLTRGTSLSASLDWVADQPVVFYDVDNRRAWLVDGASALLYMVRASIERDREREAYRGKWRFNGQLNGRSPIEILSDLDNMNTALYLDHQKRNGSGAKEDVLYSFQDRVQEILQNLEALIDSQVLAAAQDGYWIRKSGAAFAKTAVGFDFWDAAKPPGLINGRVHSLQTGGYGWIDYIRSIGALVIFGNEFGELICAESTDSLCPSWRSVQSGADFMCASVQTLKVVQKAKVTTRLGPGELTNGIIWSSRCDLFKPCQCLTPPPRNRASSHVDPVQVLLPKGKRAQLDVAQACSKITLCELGDHGAVVFGHTPYHKTRLKLRYEKSSDQEKGSASSGSNTGSNGEQTAMGGSSAYSPQSLNLLLKLPNARRDRTAPKLSCDDIEIRDRPPAKPKKRWSWLQGLCL